MSVTRDAVIKLYYHQVRGVKSATILVKQRTRGRAASTPRRTMTVSNSAHERGTEGVSHSARAGGRGPVSTRERESLESRAVNQHVRGGQSVSQHARGGRSVSTQKRVLSRSTQEGVGQSESARERGPPSPRPSRCFA